MARVLLPNFVFLWIPASEREAMEEERLRTNIYQNAMKLFNENRCKHSFTKIESFDSLLDTLEKNSTNEEEDELYRPIFILIGHGSKNQGWLTFSKSGAGLLTPRRIVNHWRPKKHCDFIATQCSSSYFFNFINNPCLLQLQNVRWIPLGDRPNPATHTIGYTIGEVSFHIELMSVLESYLVSYPELITLDIKKRAWVRSNLDSLKDWWNEKNTVEIEVTEKVDNPIDATDYMIIPMIIINFMLGMPTLFILLLLMYYILPKRFVLILIIIGFATRSPVLVLLVVIAVCYHLYRNKF